MELLAKRPKGLQDMLPDDAHKWKTIEKIAMETAEQYGFREIRIPTFESTNLFKRSVGDTTDVVQKEMYTVSAKSSANGKSESSFTLRPEGTAGTVRALLENGLLNEALPQKLFYIISCFRHENTQAGRLREFHQFGVEMFGSKDPSADADVIALAWGYLSRLGIDGIKLFINSIGCPICRAEYSRKLREFFSPHVDELCDTCKERLEKNPMRILDCKSKICSNIGENAPVILDFLCDECSSHFEKLKNFLKIRGFEFTVNPKIVRGLDYYTKTVFEFVSSDIGAQGTVCGGGRYDGLVQQLGGENTPALGFAMGLERLILIMEKQGRDFIVPKKCDLFLATMGEQAVEKAVLMAQMLRDEGFWVEFDTMGRGLKAQMKYADKIGASFTIVIGDNELENNAAKLKNMSTRITRDIQLDKSFIDVFSNEVVCDMFGEIFDKDNNFEK